jgi:hypothetical protein
MKAGKILKIAAPGYVDSHAEHLRNDLIDNLNILLSTAETFNADLAATEENRELSPQGRTAAGVRVAASALATLNAIETTTIKNLTDRATLVEKSMLGQVMFTPPKDPAERIAHEMALQEIRSQLRELSAAERLSTYFTSTDPLTLAAIDTAPMTLSAKRPDGSRRLEHFVDPEQRTAAMFARAEAANPTAANTLREVRSLREVYTHAVNGLRAEILSEVPGATPKPELTVV